MLTQDEIETTARLYRALGSTALVGEKLGITGAAVVYRLKKAGIDRTGKWKSTPRVRRFVHTPVSTSWTPADIWTPDEVRS